MAKAKRNPFDKAREKKLSKRPTLPDVVRHQINSDLSKRGLDGNGNFRGPSHGISEAFGVLSHYDIVPVDSLSGDLFIGDSGRRTLRVGVPHTTWVTTDAGMPDMQFMPPVELENTALTFTWYRRESGNFEILAFLS